MSTEYELRFTNNIVIYFNKKPRHTSEVSETEKTVSYDASAPIDLVDGTDLVDGINLTGKGTLTIHSSTSPATQYLFFARDYKKRIAFEYPFINLYTTECFKYSGREPISFLEHLQGTIGKAGAYTSMKATPHGVVEFSQTLLGVGGL